MKKYIVQSIAFSFCVFLAACNTDSWHFGGDKSPKTKQKINLNLSSTQMNWNVVNKSSDDKKGIVVTLMPENQNLSRWKEGIRTSTILYSNEPTITAENFVQNEMVRAKKYCNQVDSNIIAQTTQSTTYQLNIARCSGGFPDQIMFGKAFNGIDGVYAVRYSAKMNQVSDSEINTMANVVKDSKLINS